MSFPNDEQERVINHTGKPLIVAAAPGTGKTTLAFLIAKKTEAHFIAFSAVLSGVKDIRKVITQATDHWKLYGKPTILFVDEIHRFNKAQQDAFLPHVENGTIVLLGATTQNPSFEVIPPLLSRAKVFVLNPLKETDVQTILERAISDKERGLGDYGIRADPIAIRHIARMTDGDARRALNALEFVVITTAPDKEGTRKITIDMTEDVVRRWVDDTLVLADAAE